MAEAPYLGVVEQRNPAMLHLSHVEDEPAEQPGIEQPRRRRKRTLKPELPLSEPGPEPGPEPEAEPVPRRPGRPCTYRREIADAICHRLATGESLKSICESDGMPPRKTVCQWAEDDWDGFAERYHNARRLGYEVMADEILEIADELEQRLSDARWYAGGGSRAYPPLTAAR